MKKILIMEGDGKFASALSEFLVGMGFEVIGAIEDAEEGMKLIENVNPSVTVLDLDLTSMDGIAVLETAKRRGLRTDFIVLGNSTALEVINRVIALGARYYFAKPIPVVTVAERVAELCSEFSLISSLRHAGKL